MALCRSVRPHLRRHLPCIVRIAGSSTDKICNIRLFCEAQAPISAKLSWADRLRAFQEDPLESEHSSDGWLYGYALDGKGGARKLEPWDDQVCEFLSRLQRQDGEAKCDGEVKDDDEDGDVPGRFDMDHIVSRGDVKGFWVHIDFTRAKNVKWVWDVVQSMGPADAVVDSEDLRTEDMRTLWLSRLAETDRVSLPRCEISSDADALFLSLRVGSHIRSATPGYSMNVVELRICLTKALLLTTKISKLPDGIRILPEVEESLLEGRGGKSCGELAAILLDRGTARSTSAARDAYESVLRLRTAFQRKSLARKGIRPIGRKELALLSQDLSLVRYGATRLSRNLTQQRDALQVLSKYAQKRKQKLFSRADATRCRQAFERQDALEETLDDVGDSAEVLHGEIMTHINWGTAEGTYRLTILGGMCSVLIIVNIGASLYEFSERQTHGLQEKNARYLNHYFRVHDVADS